MLKHPVTIGFFLIIANCTEPCLELSTRLCKCEPTQGRQQNCVQTKKSEAASRKTNVQEQEVCEGLLDKDECQENTICEGRNDLECGLSAPNEQGAE